MQTAWTCKKSHSNKYKCLEVLHKIFSAKLKTLDKAPWLGLVWNYILEETIKKSWETQMFGKRCSGNCRKIHSEPSQTSKMEFFTKIVMAKAINYFCKKLPLRYLIGFWRWFWFWQIMHWHFSLGIYLFKVSTTTSGRGSYKYFFLV